MEILYAIIAFGGALAVATSLRILKEYERAVVFRLGRVRPLRGPGMIFLVPFAVERMERVSLRVIAMDIPPQDVITRDNVSVKVNAVLYFRVADPLKAVLEIEDYLFATSQLAQTTLRSVIGQADLDHLLAERERFNEILREIIDEGTDPWGIEVTGVEVKDVDLPQEMKRAMARQAEAERERRAKVISAEGEFQAAIKLRDAAGLLSQEPASLQLRFLQTASEIAAENNSTTLFPLPIDLFSGPLQGLFRKGSSAARAPDEEGAGAAAETTSSPKALAEASTPELPAGETGPFDRPAGEAGSAEEIARHLDKDAIARRARRRVAEVEPEGDGESAT